MEISQLKMFKTVADEGSIIKASEVLHCVPSNITTRIKLLEKELNYPLFIKKGRGLVISPTGIIFLEYTNRILSLCDEARCALSSSSLPSGILKISAIESFAISRFPQLLSKYHKKYPAVQLQFSTGEWPHLQKDVLNHKIDGAIIAVDVIDASLSRMEIYKEDLILISSSSTKISKPQDLIGKNIFMWPSGCPYRHTLEKWFEKYQINLPIISIASYATILSCVSSGSAISLVPNSIYEKFKELGGIYGFYIEELKPIQCYFVWNSNAKFHYAKDAFIDLLKSEC